MLTGWKVQKCWSFQPINLLIISHFFYHILVCRESFEWHLRFFFHKWMSHNQNELNLKHKYGRLELACDIHFSRKGYLIYYLIMLFYCPLRRKYSSGKGLYTRPNQFARLNKLPYAPIHYHLCVCYILSPFIYIPYKKVAGILRALILNRLLKIVQILCKRKNLWFAWKKFLAKVSFKE